MKELGEAVLQRQAALKKALSTVKGIKLDRFSGVTYEEFVADFSESGKSVAEINESLLANGILGGFDLGTEFPELEGCMLICVTERTTADDIKALKAALEEILG